jgi:hypothetical protein
MIHIVHNASDVDVLKKAIELDESMAGEVIQVRDDFAVGGQLLRSIPKKGGTQGWNTGGTCCKVRLTALISQAALMIVKW